MSIKNFFIKIYSRRRAQAALEITIGGMILVGLTGMILSQGWGYAFANYNSFSAMRTSLMLSYKYSYGAFGAGEEALNDIFNPYEGGDDGTGYSGSASRMQANVIIVEDRLAPTSLGKFGALNRTPYMVQGGPGSHSANLFMPLNDLLPRHLPRLDVYVNGEHFPFTVANYRIVNLYRPGTKFWEKYCLHATNLQTFMILDDHGNPNPEFVSKYLPFLPFYDTDDQMIIDEDGNYVGPSSSDSGDAMPHPLYGFVANKNPNKWRFLPPQKYPNAPFVGCERMYYRQYNQGDADGWCDGQLHMDPHSDGADCGYICADERFDLDLSGQQNQEEPKPQPVSRRDPNPVCKNKTDDVPNDLRPYFAWEWLAKNGVQDGREDTDEGTFKVKEGTKLRYGEPVRRHDYLDVPGPGPGEESIVYDRDLVEEQVIKISKTDQYFGVIEQMWVLDTGAGDLDFNSNDGHEVGFYYGDSVDGSSEITLQSPLLMEAQVQNGTYMSVEDTETKVITKRQKKKVDMISRAIRLSNDNGRFCNGGAPAPDVDGEPNPVKACGDCNSLANQYVTCFEHSDPTVNGSPMIYVRSIISDTRGQTWIADK